MSWLGTDPGSMPFAEEKDLTVFFFVALAAIACVLPYSHHRSLYGRLGGKPPLPAELTTSGSQPLNLVSETILHVTLHLRLKMQRSCRIEGAQIAVLIPSIFLCFA